MIFASSPRNILPELQAEIDEIHQEIKRTISGVG